jgi:hypothetical protein
MTKLIVIIIQLLVIVINIPFAFGFIGNPRLVAYHGIAIGVSLTLIVVIYLYD